MNYIYIFYEILILIQTKNVIVCCFLVITNQITQEHLDEMERVSSSLIKVLGSNPALGMQQH